MRQNTCKMDRQMGTGEQRSLRECPGTGEDLLDREIWAVLPGDSSSGLSWPPWLCAGVGVVPLPSRMQAASRSLQSSGMPTLCSAHSYPFTRQRTPMTTGTCW